LTEPCGEWQVTQPSRNASCSKTNIIQRRIIDEAITRKPKGHDFVIDRRHRDAALPRHMSMTGG
jgi:hypothetical protein